MLKSKIESYLYIMLWFFFDFFYKEGLKKDYEQSGFL